MLFLHLTDDVMRQGGNAFSDNAFSVILSRERRMLLHHFHIPISPIFLMETFELIAKTFQGLEEVLAQELTELGADEIQIGRRMVSFVGDKRMMYRANFCLRTAVRILKPIKHFKAGDPDEVYQAVKGINWADYLDLTTSFSVDTTVYSTTFRNSRFVTYKIKDAIVDYFVEREGKRPNVSVANPQLRLNIHIAEDVCTLSLDSSGESLHLRGYREATVEAPINEVLAAAIIKMSGWKFDCDIVDPFCGSGTFLVEAALMARNIHPGIFRKRFGFENWKDFDADLLAEIYDDDSQEREFNHHIYGYDLNHNAVRAALENVKAAGVADYVTVEQRDIRDFALPEVPEGSEQPRRLMITNPPYGERLHPEDITAIYRTLGRKLKHDFTGNEAWIICSKEALFDALGLKPSQSIALQNGALDCEVRRFVTFSGKMESFRGDGGILKTDEDLRRQGERRRDGREREFSRKFDPDFKNRRRERDDNAASERQRPEDFFEDEEMAAHYRSLRNRHRNFEEQQSRERRQTVAGRDRNDRRADRREGGKGSRDGFKGARGGRSGLKGPRRDR